MHGLNLKEEQVKEIDAKNMLVVVDLIFLITWSQFIGGINFDNRELWEIDHVRPISSFDLSNDAKGMFAGILEI